VSPSARHCVSADPAGSARVGVSASSSFPELSASSNVLGVRCHLHREVLQAYVPKQLAGNIMSSIRARTAALVARTPERDEHGDDVRDDEHLRGYGKTAYSGTAFQDQVYGCEQSKPARARSAQPGWTRRKMRRPLG
jgi:hypothetical protein